MYEFIDNIKDQFFKNERIIEMSQVAREHNFRFIKNESFKSQRYELKAFDLFSSKKRKRKLKAVFHFQNDIASLKTRIYDHFEYSDSGIKETTVYEIWHEEFDFPKFQIRPRNTFDKMKSIFVTTEPIYAELSDFHNKFDIETNQASELLYELNEDMLLHLLGRTEYRLEGHGKYLIFYRKNKQTPINDLMIEYDFAIQLVDLFFNGNNQSVKGFV